MCNLLIGSVAKLYLLKNSLSLAYGYFLDSLFGNIFCSKKTAMQAGATTRISFLKFLQNNEA